MTLLFILLFASPIFLLVLENQYAARRATWLCVEQPHESTVLGPYNKDINMKNIKEIETLCIGTNVLKIYNTDPIR